MKPPSHTAESPALFAINSPAQAYPNLANQKLIEKLPQSTIKLIKHLDAHLLSIMDKLQGPMPSEDLIYTQSQFATLTHVRTVINEFIMEDATVEGDMGDSLDDVFNAHYNSH